MSEETPQEEPQPVLAPPRKALPLGQVLLGTLILVCGFIIGACCTILFAKDLIEKAGERSPKEMAAPISRGTDAAARSHTRAAGGSQGDRRGADGEPAGPP